MIVTILGWYGTETIGDRAILAGVIAILEKAFGSIKVLLGTLHPFFTERSVLEDFTVYEDVAGGGFQIELFDVRCRSLLKKSINRSDMVVMGGGPVMEVRPLVVIDSAFAYARRRGVPTVLLGCGFGPFYSNRGMETASRLLRNSSLSIWRDDASMRMAISTLGRSGTEKLQYKMKTSLDPAIEILLRFRDQFESMGLSQSDFVAVNAREPTGHYYREKKVRSVVLRNIQSLLEGISKCFEHRSVRWIPMHYFHEGGDDRVYLNRLRFGMPLHNVAVQNDNLSLKRTAQIFYQAAYSIGMRYHSIVFQTILSGRNAVIDYTDEKKGKVVGFVRMLNAEREYRNRYVHVLQTQEIGEFLCRLQDWDRRAYQPSFDVLRRRFDEEYTRWLRALMRGDTDV